MTVNCAMNPDPSDLEPRLILEIASRSLDAQVIIQLLRMTGYPRNFELIIPHQPLTLSGMSYPSASLLLKLRDQNFSTGLWSENHLANPQLSKEILDRETHFLLGPPSGFLLPPESITQHSTPDSFAATQAGALGRLNLLLAIGRPDLIPQLLAAEGEDEGLHEVLQKRYDGSPIDAQSSLFALPSVMRLTNAQVLEPHTIGQPASTCESADHAHVAPLAFHLLPPTFLESLSNVSATYWRMIFPSLIHSTLTYGDTQTLRTILTSRVWCSSYLGGEVWSTPTRLGHIAILDLLEELAAPGLGVLHPSTSSSANLALSLVQVPPVPSDVLSVASEANQIESLEWWSKRMRSGEAPSDEDVIMKLSPYRRHGPRAVDVASSHGLIEVLDWWRTQPDLEMRWTHAAVDEASRNGHVVVLQWWLDHHEELGFKCSPNAPLLSTDATSSNRFNAGAVGAWWSEHAEEILTKTGIRISLPERSPSALELDKQNTFQTGLDLASMQGNVEQLDQIVSMYAAASQMYAAAVRQPEGGEGGLLMGSLVVESQSMPPVLNETEVIVSFARIGEQDGIAPFESQVRLNRCMDSGDGEDKDGEARSSMSYFGMGPPRRLQLEARTEEVTVENSKKNSGHQASYSSEADSTVQVPPLSGCTTAAPSTPGSGGCSSSSVVGSYPALKWSERALDSASAAGYVDVLQWWHGQSQRGCRISDSGEGDGDSPCFHPAPLRYSSASMDLASANGHVDVLEWWIQSGLELKYTHAAMDEASRNGHVNVLQWWRCCELELKWTRDAIDCSHYSPGAIAVLCWWAQSGLPLLYSAAAVDGIPSSTALTTSQKLDLLAWWFMPPSQRAGNDWDAQQLLNRPHIAPPSVTARFFDDLTSTCYNPKLISFWLSITPPNEVLYSHKAIEQCCAPKGSLLALLWWHRQLQQQQRHHVHQGGMPPLIGPTRNAANLDLYQLQRLPIKVNLPTLSRIATQFGFDWLLEWLDSPYGFGLSWTDAASPLPPTAVAHPRTRLWWINRQLCNGTEQDDE